LIFDVFAGIGASEACGADVPLLFCFFFLFIVYLGGF